MAPLPPSLADLYYSYKDSTNYVLGWMRLNCRPSEAVPAEEKLKTTAEIINAAKRVRDLKKEVPQSVLASLADAIKTRQKVLEIVRGLEVSANGQNDADSDRTHAAFIQRLSNVLEILMPLRAANAANPVLSPDEARMMQTINRFEGLDLLQDVESSDSESNSSDGPLEPSAIEEPAEEVSKNESDSHRELLGYDGIVLEDDDIGEWIELTHFIYEWDSICKVVNDCWVEAAEGKIPILMAAWVSNMAFKQAGQIFERKIPKIVKTYDELVEKWMYHKSKGIDLMFDDDEGLLDQGRGRFANLNGLCHPGEVLQYRRTKGKYKVARREAADRRDPVTIIQPPWAWLQAQEKADVIHDDLAFDMFQENMRLLLENGRGIAGVESFRGPGRACEPLLMLWKEALDEPEKPLSAKLVFGLEMVLSTFKSFLWPDVMTNKTNCRIAALKFAQDVKSNLAQTLDILQKDAGPEKSRTRQEHEDRLISMIAKMDMFCREKRFDLYYQAPWIAGCHMLEFHTLAMHDGVYVCSVSGHVCATLHMYNALRQVGNKPIKSIPILDFLCEIFKDRLFFGAFPKKKFSTYFRRAQGCGIQKNKDLVGWYASGLAQPFTKDAYRKSHMDTETISLFHTAHMWDYTPKRWSFWNEIFGDPDRKASEKEAKRLERWVSLQPMNMIIERVKNKVLPELKGEKPVARLNFFAVFRLCVRIMERFAKDLPKVARLNVNKSMLPQGAGLGSLYVDIILDDFSAQLDDDYARKHIEEFPGLLECRRIFESLQENLDVASYLWSF
ncbi:hypothetical protein Brms1b_003919 [Colletotrichum noveboracense]|nr:hypothetical protein CBS470a_011070 [Colletotrichum nupharicola]KAJ0319223.1 hypothetical protein Brms1b_003919 [Colletotrichum noveboracense]